MELLKPLEPDSFDIKHETGHPSKSNRRRQDQAREAEAADRAPKQRDIELWRTDLHATI